MLRQDTGCRGRINATPEVFILLLKGGGVTSYLSGEAVQTYEKALALGKKEGQKLPALETVLAEERIFSPKEMPLGQVQIPLELIVGKQGQFLQQKLLPADGAAYGIFR